VTLHEQSLLLPGKTEQAMLYQGRYYHFRGEEAQLNFLRAPFDYLPLDAPVAAPPPRIILLGPPGSGKTLQGRRLAAKHGMVHLDFRARLRVVARLEDHPLRRDVLGHVTNPDEVPLDSEIAVQVVKEMWEQAPASTCGFILEGFPRNDDDMQAMLPASLWPDVLVHLQVSLNICLRRALPQRVRLWQDTTNQELARRAERAEALEAEKAGRLAAHMRAQARLRAEWEAERRTRRDAGEALDEAEQFQEEPYEALPDEEPDDGPVLETPEEARERLETEITDAHEAQSEAASSMLEAYQEKGVKTATLSADLSKGAQARALAKVLAPYLEERLSLLERARPLSLLEAEARLRDGNASLSSLGTWCPIQLWEWRNARAARGKPASQAMPPPQPLCVRRYAASYRRHVYYCAGLPERERFVANPLRYLCGATAPATPAGRTLIAVVGPPGSGKAALAHRIAAEAGLPLVRVADAAAFVLEQQQGTVLAQAMHAVLRQGKLLPLDLAVAALTRYVNRGESGVRGFVLDGAPLSEELWDTLAEAGLTPACILELTATTQGSAPAAASTLNHARRLYEQHVRPLRERCQREHRTWHMLDAGYSQWRLFATAMDAVVRTMSWRVAYATAQRRGEPAPLFGAAYSLAKLEALASGMGRLDVVLWADKSQLVEVAAGNLMYAYEVAGATGPRIFYTSSAAEARRFEEDWKVGDGRGLGGLALCLIFAPLLGVRPGPRLMMGPSPRISATLPSRLPRCCRGGWTKRRSRRRFPSRLVGWAVGVAGRGNADGL
jgi:adenylate kinase family enzyme/YHS domain-containing protein